MKFIKPLLLSLGLSNLVLGALPEQLVPKVNRSGEIISMDWESTAGLTYFVQYSLDMVNWSYLPVIEGGTGSEIGYGLESSSENMFVRLHYTDQTAADLLTADFDGDNVSNWDEVRNGGTGTSPFIADTNGDGVRDDGLVYAAESDPDGAGLPASLQSSLLARWDFEQLNGNSTFTDKTGNGWIATSYGVTIDPEGIVSKSADFGNGYLSVDGDVLGGEDKYSLSFWMKLDEGSIRNMDDFRIAGVYGLQNFHYSVTNGRIFNSVSTNALRVQKRGTTEYWNFGHFFQTNFHLGVHGQNHSTQTDTVSWTRPLGTTDTGQWHHVAIVREDGRRSIGQYTVYFDNEVVASGSFADRILFGTLIFGRFITDVGAVLPSVTQMKGDLDRVSLYGKALSASEVQDIYRQDIDADGLWDVTEQKTSYWDDINGNAIEELGERAYTVSPLYFHYSFDDHDADTATSLEEQEAGTNIGLADTDGDLLPDGWELRYGLDPLLSFDAALDIDNDGLTAAQEYAVSGTDPRTDDTDDDGIGDKDDFPPKWISISRNLRYDYNDYPDDPDALKKLTTEGRWMGSNPTEEKPASILPYNQLHTSLEQKQAFPATFPKTRLDQFLFARGVARTLPSPACYHATLDHKQVVVQVAGASNEARNFIGLLETSRDIDTDAQDPIVSMVAVTVPAGQTESSTAEMNPFFTGTGSNGSDDYTEEVIQSLYPVSLKEVTFTGDEQYPLKGEDLTSYAAPHWVDNDADGNPSNTAGGERNYPVAYAGGSTPSLTAVFDMGQLHPQLGKDVKLRATGPDGISFPERPVSFRNIEGTWEYPETASSAAWQQIVKFYDKNNATKAFQLNWEIKVDSGSWTNLITTTHTIYVTLGERKIVDTTETWYYLGCKNADGKTTEAEVRTAIYADFTDQQINRIDGELLYYYREGEDLEQLPTTAGTMLTDSKFNGNCTAWAELFTILLKLQGIDASTVSVTPKSPNTQMIVKEVNFIGNRSTYLSDAGDVLNLGNQITITGTGIFGQGKTKAPQLFTNHCIVSSGGNYYDPSYGTPLKTSAKSYEDSVFAGYGVVVDGVLDETLEAKKNNTSVSSGSDVNIN